MVVLVDQVPGSAINTAGPISNGTMPTEMGFPSRFREIF
jgi:hypothetical protein